MSNRGTEFLIVFHFESFQCKWKSHRQLVAMELDSGGSGEKRTCKVEGLGFCSQCTGKPPGEGVDMGA